LFIKQKTKNQRIQTILIFFKMKTKIFLTATLGLFLTATAVQAQSITGKVVSRDGQPVSGAVITYGDRQGLTADDSGEFTIDSKKSGGRFTVNYLGYKSQDVKIKKDAQNRPLTITLEEDEEALRDVVVVGYGKTTKEKNTGSVSTITAETLERYSGKSVLDVLQGRVAGLQIASRSGLPGSTAKINIRGTNTVGSSFIDGCAHESCCVDPDQDKQTVTEPLIIVDGVPFINQSLSSLSIGAAGATGPLATLSPQDIERIDILKDADATAIYGTRGANGVILISTKKGLTEIGGNSEL
jgi:TonB-dependent SusC/RagA subfamily outer membrane receptor